MRILEDEDLKNINGGISAWAVAGIGMLVTFFAGVLDGIVRPLKCRS